MASATQPSGPALWRAGAGSLFARAAAAGGEYYAHDPIRRWLVGAAAKYSRPRRGFHAPGGLRFSQPSRVSDELLVFVGFTRTGGA